MDKIQNSGKSDLTMLMLEAKKDVRSYTGSNYRNIMLLVGKLKVEDVKLGDEEAIMTWVTVCFFIKFLN